MTEPEAKEESQLYYLFIAYCADAISKSEFIKSTATVYEVETLPVVKCALQNCDDYEGDIVEASGDEEQ